MNFCKMQWKDLLKISFFLLLLIWNRACSALVAFSNYTVLEISRNIGNVRVSRDYAASIRKLASRLMKSNCGEIIKHREGVLIIIPRTKHRVYDADANMCIHAGGRW